MSHILCHSLRWSEHHKTRCVAMLYALRRLSLEYDAKVVLVGDILHNVQRNGNTSLTSLLELQKYIVDVPLHVIPAHDYDTMVCELLHIPYYVNTCLDDVAYSPSNRAHIPALFPSTAKEYCRTRHVLLRTPEETRKLPFPFGPKMHIWKRFDDDLTSVRGGDLVRLINPTMRHMRRCRVLKGRGVRIQNVQHARVRRSFWDFFNVFMNNHPARESIHALLQTYIVDAPRIRLQHMRIEHIQTPCIWIDMTGSGLEWVGGSNGSGKTTIFIHAWIWLFLGLWRGQRINMPPTDAFVMCEGYVGSVPFRLERRVGEYEHTCRLTYNGHDETKETPMETTMFFHQQILKWYGTSSVFYMKWMNLLVLHNDTPTLGAPHDMQLKNAYAHVKEQFEACKRTYTRVNKQIRALESEVELFQASFSMQQQDWSSMLLTMQNEYASLEVLGVVDKPEGDPNEAFNNALQRVEELRQQYFDVIRRRRQPIEHTEDTSTISQLRRQLLHAQQEQYARRQQDCNFGERIDAHIMVERVETKLDRALRRAKKKARRKMHSETHDALVRISEEIVDASNKIDKLYVAVKTFNKQQEAYKIYKAAQTRMHTLREHIGMIKEDRIGQISHMQKNISSRRERLESHCMFKEELVQRLSTLQHCLYIDDMRVEWNRAWFEEVDGRANGFWQLARWDESCNLHNGYLFKDGATMNTSQGMRARKNICYFFAIKEAYDILPYAVLNNIDASLDIDGRVGLERLVQLYLDKHATRTCWWLTRTREGTININGV